MTLVSTQYITTTIAELPSRNSGANMLKRRQIIRHDDADRRQVNAGLHNASIIRSLKHVGLP